MRDKPFYRSYAPFAKLDEEIMALQNYFEVYKTDSMAKGVTSVT